MGKTYKILNCPFCGGKGELVERSGGWTVSCYYSDIINAMEVGVKYCPMSDVTTVLAWLPETAIEIWNTRNNDESYTTIEL